jgi:hypothetical protein
MHTHTAIFFIRHFKICDLIYEWRYNIHNSPRARFTHLLSVICKLCLGSEMQKCAVSVQLTWYSKLSCTFDFYPLFMSVLHKNYTQRAGRFVSFFPFLSYMFIVVSSGLPHKCSSDLVYEKLLYRIRTYRKTRKIIQIYILRHAFRFSNCRLVYNNYIIQT